MDKVDAKDFVILRIEKGIYGLSYAGIITQVLLTKRLEKHDSFQSDKTPGFWTDKLRPISFTLIVDNFGVKHVGKEHADHLIRVLKEHYVVEKDWLGKKYCGITIDWDHNRRKVHLPMPGYCSKALTRFRYDAGKNMDQPHQHAVPV